MLSYCMDYTIPGAVRASVSGDRNNLSWAVFDRSGEILRANIPLFFAPGLTGDEIAQAREAIANMIDAPFTGDVYIRFNDLPKSRKSTNHATGKTEAGISCYRAAWDIIKGCYVRTGSGLDGAALAYLLSGVPIYLVTGRETGVGSDGEPLLSDVEILARMKFDMDKDGYTIRE